MTQKEIERTEIEAPYELPEGWKWCRLGDVIETSKEKTDTFSSEMKYVGLEHIDSNGKINGWTSAGDVKSLKNIFHANQILYGKLRPYLNKHDIADFTGVCSTDILVFNAKTDCSNKYINYFFNLPYFIDFAVSNSKGINLPRVPERIILEIPFPLPPTLAEQQRIVNRIETMFAKLDQAQEKAQAVLDSFETRKAAILHKAFTGELTANWRKENGVPDDSWEEKLFDSCIAKMQNGLSKRSGNEGTETVVLRLANIGENDFDVSDLRTIKLTSKEQENYSLTKEDVVMIRVNGSKTNVGRQLLVRNNDGWSFCDHIIRIRFETFCLPTYMVYFSNTKEYKDYIQDNMVSSAGQNTISRKGLSNLSLRIPTLDEQQEIVRILDTVLEKESRAKESAQTVLDQITLLKKSILARAFRGEL